MTTNDVPEEYYRDFQDYYQAAIGRMLDPESRMLTIDTSLYRALQDAFAAGTRARREPPVIPGRNALTAGKMTRHNIGVQSYNQPFQGAQDRSFALQEVASPVAKPEFEHTGTVWRYREPETAQFGAPGPVPTAVEDDWPSGPMDVLPEDHLGDATHAWLKGLRDDVHTPEEGVSRPDPRRYRGGRGVPVQPPRQPGPRPAAGGVPDRRGDPPVRRRGLRDRLLGHDDAPPGQHRAPPYLP